jgi:hypothetical protein
MPNGVNVMMRVASRVSHWILVLGVACGVYAADSPTLIVTGRIDAIQITLSNSTDRIMGVDRELILGFRIYAMDKTGEEIGYAQPDITVHSGFLWVIE